MQVNTVMIVVGSRAARRRGGRGRSTETESHEDHNDDQDERAGYGADHHRERHVQHVGRRALAPAHQAAEELSEEATRRRAPHHTKRPAHHHLPDAHGTLRIREHLYRAHVRLQYMSKFY